MKFLIKKNSSGKVSIQWDEKKSTFTKKNNTTTGYSYLRALNVNQSLQSISPISFAAIAYSSSREITTPNTINIGANNNNNPLYQALELRKNIRHNQPQTIHWIANAITKKALAAMRGDLEKANQYGAIITKIETIISKLAGYEIKFELLDNPIKVVLKHDNQQISFDHLSDGLKSLISWIADLLLRLDQTPWVDDIPVLERNFILFLDEIEVHLHPSLQRKILPIVQDLFPNAQIFISTHSPFVVGSVSDAWVYKLALKDGISKISEPIPSKAGISFQAILEDIFDVDEEFDVQTENLLDEFYALRNKIAQGEEIDNNKFKNLITKLSSKSVEVKDIIEREVRQLQRKRRL